MASFLARRLLSGVAISLVVVTCVFFITRVVSDPVQAMLPPTAPPEQFDAVRRAFGFDQPLYVQYIDFLRGLVMFDFGNSMSTGVPVRELIAQRLPATLQLVLAALLICAVIFLPAGIWAGLRPGSLSDRVIVSISMVMISVPAFWLGAMLILVFAVNLGVLPTSGATTPAHYVLPAVTLSAVSGARIASIARSAVIDERHAPYVTSLKGRGIAAGQIVRRHLLRNVMLPIATIFFWEAAMLAANSLLVETVFSWPGIGQLIVTAVGSNDFPVLQGAIMTVALLVVLINTAADVVYWFVDPRIELR